MTDPVTMSSILSDATLIVTEALKWLVQVVNVITGQPLLLLFAILGLVGLGIGIYRRLVG